jgi:hypothetical protein
MKLLIAILLIALCASTIEGILWRRKDKDGNDIVRAIKVLKSPRNGFDHTFEVVAGRKNTDTQDIDAIRFLFSTVWTPRHVINHFSRDEDSAELFSARWLLWKLVEYQNVDSAPEYDPRTDNKVSDYHLWGRSWSTLAYTQTTIDGAEYHALCTELNDTQPRPDVKICINIADRRVLAKRADPNAIKFSLEIGNYPYQTANTRLALKVSFNSKNIVRDLAESGDGEARTEIDKSAESALEVATEDDGSRGIASWNRDIDVTGTGCSPTGSITRSVVFEGQVQREIDTLPIGDPDLFVDRVHRIVYFSFITDCQPETILWDPEFGVAVEENGVSIAVPSFFLLAIFVVLQLFL